jgi:hypothetical protein
MTLTLATASRNAACKAVTDLVDAGAGAGKLKIKASSTVLVTITLANPAFGAPSTGVATAASLPKSGVAANAGTADGYEITDGSDVVVASGSVTITGGGGDITLDNTSITVGQTVTLNTLTHTQPA